MWAQLTTSLTAPAPLLEPIPTAAGDGSVIGAGSMRASGAWAVVHGSVSVTGNVKCYWADITSTRCECHALIAGLHLSGDSGVQVCDNKAVI
ncbi:hypothetical protein PF005_g13915 [Phytophthora fragariae]|uniref:RNase H type-1 domain-containing protein n=2 Tax=Phytophthora TaxID=4783 RepID=A0A6A3SKJ9_9STRA|nr:hypothetical protein PF003_g40277 [Phytophthora fragariae]KAE9015768.1 hypothetical protein PR002_g13837 [Phytophthora rubi]KAE8940845.1 hypothetical protein PF009_g9357 [Phytophthora fragariae]KAE9020583.1 hypothetical protein PR001_g13563 [Phytophthora rubi]KAE9118669.1 hypothetical protein PF007_g8851 [Phytophthora fragariae]